MNFAILRIDKLKEWGHIGGSLSHTYRTRETPNADPARLASNEHHGPQTPEAVMEAMKARMPEKVRKNAVLAIEYFIGGSPEHFKGTDGSKYFEDARQWLIKKHGAENVISTHVHRDETTPHMVAYVVPIVNDKLNARHFFGGPDAMRQMQTDFAQEVGAKHGLERGIEGSQAKHQTIREYYARANGAEAKLDRVTHPTERHVEKRLLTRTEESDAQFAARVASDVKAQLRPAVIAAAQAPMTERRAKELQRNNAWLSRQAKPWLDAIHGLNDRDHSTLTKALGAASDKMRAMTGTVRGWLRSLGSPDSPNYVIERLDDGRRQEVSEAATRALRRAGADLGDVVEATGRGAKILHKERGRGGPSLER